MSKMVRVLNGVVQEIIPYAATVPSVEHWYGLGFASQCFIAPDEVQQGWVYDVLNDTFSVSVQQEFIEPPTDDISIIKAAVDTLKLENTTLQNAVDLLTIALLEG